MLTMLTVCAVLVDSEQVKPYECMHISYDGVEVFGKFTLLLFIGNVQVPTIVNIPNCAILELIALVITCIGRIFPDLVTGLLVSACVPQVG